MADRDPGQVASLYHPTLGVFPFQGEAVARCYLRFTDPKSTQDAVALIFSTGTGKTHIAMGLACLLFEDSVIDHVVVVAEQAKVTDWAKGDIPKHTDLTARIYQGSARKKVLVNPPQVLVTTYETYRNDVAVFRPRTRAIVAPGPLLDWMRDKRVLLVYDEVSRLRTRTSQTYVAHDYALNRVLRRIAPWIKVLGLTATTVERSPEDTFNMARILGPQWVPTVQEFSTSHVAALDLFDKPSHFKNIWNPGDGATPWDSVTVPLVDRIAPLVIRKQKSDPDVRAQFPAMVEEPPTVVDLGVKHRAFYDTITDIYRDSDEQTLRVLFTLLRQVAGHPLALRYSRGKLARSIFEMVGEKGLADMGSAKEDRLIERIRRVGGEQGVVFTFYGQSILPLLADRLYREGITVALNHGGMSRDDRARSQDVFKAGDAQVFLSSDAGARGLNLGIGSWLDHYELPLFYSTYRQRSDRIHRIDSVHDSVTVGALVASGTIEEAVASLLLKRNTWSDALDQGASSDIDDEDTDPGERFITADVRKLLFGEVRGRRGR